MNPWPVEAALAEVHLPRPGHADLVGHPEVRPDRRQERPRARQRARDRGAGGRRRGGQGVPARARRRGVLARDPDHERPRSPQRGPDAAGLRERRRVAGPVPRPRRDQGDGGRDRPAAQGQRVARRACSRCARSASCLDSARTSPGRSGSTAASARRSSRSRPSRRSRSGTVSRSPALPGSQAHDEIFYDDHARLLPRDQPRRRARGRDDHRRAARRPRVDEAAADADQAAALGRHRHPRAGRGAPGADRLVHGSGGRRGGGGDGRVRARRRLPAEVRRRSHRRRPRCAARLRGADRVATVTS